MALVAVAALAFFTSTASAQQKRLKVGDTAPGIYVRDWFNGSGTVIEPEKVYVVEFWATWCAPCKKSIPHLNELHKRFQGKATIIGVSNEETDTVRSFVSQRGGGMSYLVGVDEDQKTTKAWMEAAGQSGIPVAFIVNRDRKVVWIGHPLDAQFDRVLEAVVDGKYDPVAENKARPAIEAARRAAKIRNYREASSHFDAAIAVNPAVFSNIALEKYKMLLVDAGDAKGAAAYGRELLKTYSENGIALGDLAVLIMTDEAIKERDVELAEKAAAGMVAAGGRTDPEILSRLAAVQFATGKVQEAVETQMEAWMGAPEVDKAAFKTKLDQYRNALTKAQAGVRTGG
jgi:thiol-disulfide isomerase/thioredoxin